MVMTSDPTSLIESLRSVQTLFQPDAQGHVQPNEDFSLIILELKRYQSRCIQSQKQQKEVLAALKTKYERLQVALQALEYEREIQKVRRQQLENYPKRLYLDLLKSLPEDEPSEEASGDEKLADVEQAVSESPREEDSIASQDKASMVVDDASEDGRTSGFAERVHRMRQEHAVMRRRLEKELEKRKRMNGQVRELEKKRQKLKELELKEKAEWNTFKINFKGLSQVSALTLFIIESM
jgi:hypothetical protein